MKVILTGGGTGGHIYPALALARYIKKVNPLNEILFVGAVGGMEEKIIPKAGFRLAVLPVKGLPRKINFNLLRSFYLLGKSSVHAVKIINEFKPDVIIGTGGYAAAPIILSAITKRKIIIIHEQNVIPGVTNRFLAPFVYKVCLSFEASQRYFKKHSNLCITGNPRASEVGHLEKKTARQILNMDENLPFLLAVGGSQGADRLNQCMVDFLFRSSGNKNIQIQYITGERYYEEVVSRLKTGKIFERYAGRLDLRPYQQEMSVSLAAADLVITRAGATTLAEVTALGVPAIIIPSPNVVHNHQFINAQELVGRGAAILIEEKDLNGKLLQNEIYALLSDLSKLSSMEENSRKLGYTEAAENIYKLLLSNKKVDKCQ
ncbi:MAG: undecaprenyldiphospho-muramoylpentapeptide beta-N-acetylglucosaminyltransferase [Bacillota bacterium]|nr:undecaprenyldiphospho-muramoylpentapeptide beta-N-acetylglucosaminyltransferase [Bacillota bacterium]